MTDSRPNKRIEFSPAFQKLLARAPTEIKQAVQDAIDLFEEYPDNPVLRNHPLKEEYAGFNSIDVTGDWRALYREEAERYYFSGLGTHDELYG
jgi:mRNA-degrading endonuclease YafQ of YafQ-DinJ toxin-antitoxin module